MRDHVDLAVRVDDVIAEPLDADAIHRAIALLDGAEAASHAALVDEGERSRLRALRPSPPAPSSSGPHWHPILACRDGSALGYVGVIVRGRSALADVAIDRVAGRDRPVLRALLEASRRVGEAHGAADLDVWVRHATEADLVAAIGAGFGVARRLGVMGRRLPLDGSPVALGDAPGVALRAARFEDVPDVVTLLDAAYAGTPDGGWTRERFDDRSAADWFRIDDVLVAEAPSGRLVGLHWTKRRGEGVGEVYNLAVDPDARGTGIGARLLAAGLGHLAANGMREALLWVDLANERAVRLYGAFGFTLRWEDVQLHRTLDG